MKCYQLIWWLLFQVTVQSVRCPLQFSRTQGDIFTSQRRKTKKTNMFYFQSAKRVWGMFALEITWKIKLLNLCQFSKWTNRFRTNSASIVTDKNLMFSSSVASQCFWWPVSLLFTWDQSTSNTSATKPLMWVEVVGFLIAACSWQRSVQFIFSD